MQIKYIIKAS